MTNHWQPPIYGTNETQPEREPKMMPYIVAGVLVSIAVGLAVVFSGIVKIGGSDEAVADATASSASDQAAVPTATAQPASPVTAAAPRPTATPQPIATATPRPTATPTPRYPRDWLRVDGIGQVDFGMRTPEVLEGATRSFGQPASTQDLVCPGSFDGQSYDSLTFTVWNSGPQQTALTFLDGALVGWFYTGRDLPTLATPTGLGVGSSQADLAVIYPDATIEPGFSVRTPAGEVLGDTRWSVQTNGGYFKGYLLDGVVSRMWAGAECDRR